MRRDRGQADVPRLAVVTRSMDLDLSGPLFADPARAPLVITTETADPGRVSAFRSAGADLISAGTADVDLVDAFAALRRSGVGILLVEGGPSLNGQLVAAGLIDEVCITVAPKLVGGDAARLAHGDTPGLSAFELAHVLELDGELCCRYIRAGSGSG
jgi:riboflavin biosynthesis pyrimidine reductase